MIKSKRTYDVNSNVTEKSVIITSEVCPDVYSKTPVMTPETPELTQKSKSVTLSKRASETYIEVEEVK